MLFRQRTRSNHDFIARKFRFDHEWNHFSIAMKLRSIICAKFRVVQSFCFQFESIYSSLIESFENFMYVRSLKNHCSLHALYRMQWMFSIHNLNFEFSKFHKIDSRRSFVKIWWFFYWTNVYRDCLRSLLTIFLQILDSFFFDCNDQNVWQKIFRQSKRYIRLKFKI